MSTWDATRWPRVSTRRALRRLLGSLHRHHNAPRGVIGLIGTRVDQSRRTGARFGAVRSLSRFLGAAEPHRHAVQDRLADDPLDHLVVGTIVDRDAGVRARHPLPAGARSVAPAVRQAHTPGRISSVTCTCTSPRWTRLSSSAISPSRTPALAASLE